MIKSLKSSFIVSLPLPLSSFNITRNNKLKIGIVADVHQDIIHDGFSRLSFFINAMKNIIKATGQSKIHVILALPPHFFSSFKTWGRNGFDKDSKY